jgi:hypothetical protein
MQILVALVDVGLWVWLFIMIAKDKFPADGVLILCLIFALLIVNLIAIFIPTKNNYFSLYLKRRALEEKQKIEKIEKPQT